MKLLILILLLLLLAHYVYASRKRKKHDFVPDRRQKYRVRQIIERREIDAARKQKSRLQKRRKKTIKVCNARPNTETRK